MNLNKEKKSMPTYQLFLSLDSSLHRRQPRRMHACVSPPFHCPIATKYTRIETLKEWAASVRYVTQQGKKKFYDPILRRSIRHNPTHTPFTPATHFHSSKQPTFHLQSNSHAISSKNARLVIPTAVNYQSRPHLIDQNRALRPPPSSSGTSGVFFSIFFFFFSPYRPVASDPLAKILGLVSDRKLGVYSTARVQIGERDMD